MKHRSMPIAVRHHVYVNLNPTSTTAVTEEIQNPQLKIKNAL